MHGYNRAIELDPDLAEAYSNRGHTYHDLGDYEQAIADYNRAIELYEAEGRLEETEKVRGWLSELQD